MRIPCSLGLLLLVYVASGQAPVAVSEEPMHHRVFDNGWVRLLDVHIPAGDTSLWHKHSTPSVFLILSATKTGSEVRVEPRKLVLNDGHIWFEGFYDTPRIHRVWNADDHEFHVIDMELPHRPNGKIDAPFVQVGFQLLFDEKPVRAYRVTLPSGTLRLSRRQAPMVVVCIEDGQTVLVDGGAGANEGSANGKALHERGDYVFVPAGGDIVLANQAAGDAKLAVFELK